MRRTPPLLSAEAKERAQSVNDVTNRDAFPSLATPQGKVGINIVRMDTGQGPSKRTIPSQKLPDVATETINAGFA
jgi:hypothetical protein